MADKQLDTQWIQLLPAAALIILIAKRFRCQFQKHALLSRPSTFRLIKKLTAAVNNYEYDENCFTKPQVRNNNLVYRLNFKNDWIKKSRQGVKFES